MRAFTFLALIGVSGLALAADLNRGIELYQQGKYADAESELRQVVQDDPQNGRAYLYLGLALIEQEKAADAATFLQKGNELVANGESRLAMARLYVAQKEFDKAEEAVKEAEGEDLEYVRGLVHLNKKRYEEAARDFESFLEKKPDHAYAHYHAGLAYNGMQRPDKMLTHFEMFLKLKPDAPEAKKVRAVIRTGR